MSPETNGNPPSVTKRKKNREKKPQVPPQLNPLEFNMSNCNYFPTNPNTYQNISIPDITAYYSCMNYSNPTEPMSLPVYSNYPNYYLSNPSLNFMSTPKPLVSHPSADTSEYLSLPVGNLDQIDDMSKRRFSDPGLPNDSDSSVNSIESKIIHKLTQQVNLLRESNRKLMREMTDMRIELNMLKQQQQTSRHYEREYEPGMLTDIIREVRDAARVREDALLSRVKHMIEEKQFSMNHLQLVSEKNRNNDRITKLEEQLKNLNINGTRAEEDSNHEEGNSAARQVIELEREALMLRKELQDTRAKKEESEQKLMQLDKKLANILRRNDIPTSSDASEDGKTNSTDTISVTTTSSISQIPPLRVTLSGPVTDL